MRSTLSNSEHSHHWPGMRLLLSARASALSSVCVCCSVPRRRRTLQLLTVVHGRWERTGIRLREGWRRWHANHFVSHPLLFAKTVWMITTFPFRLLLCTNTWTANGFLQPKGEVRCLHRTVHLHNPTEDMAPTHISLQDAVAALVPTLARDYE